MINKKDELYHYGVPGMRWGRRKVLPPVQAQTSRNRNVTTNNQNGNVQQDVKAARRAKAKKALKIGAAVAGTALAAYGAKKLYDFKKNQRRDLNLQKYYSAKRKAQGGINKESIQKLRDTVELKNRKRYNAELFTKDANLRNMFSERRKAQGHTVSRESINKFYDAVARKQNPKGAAFYDAVKAKQKRGEDIRNRFYSQVAKKRGYF